MPKKSIVCFVLAFIILIGLGLSLETRAVEQIAQEKNIPMWQAQIEFNNQKNGR